MDVALLVAYVLALAAHLQPLQTQEAPPWLRLTSLLNLGQGRDPGQPINPEDGRLVLAEGNMNVLPIPRSDVLNIAPDGLRVDPEQRLSQATLGIDAKRKTAGFPLGTPTPKSGLF